MRPVLLAALLSCLMPADAAAQSEEDAVVQVVQRFFDTMAARDVEEMSEILVPEGRFFSVREEGADVVLGGSTHGEFLELLAATEDHLVERMWEPKVLIHGRIAMVWAPYDFWRNDEFSHCGVDSFSLIKTSDGWKIAGVIYTVEPTGCDDGPARD